MRINYHANDEPFYYLCNFRYVAHAEPLCQSLAGKPLEELITAELLQAIKPAGLELSIQAAADLRCERQRLDRHWQLRLERARIEADRAARQYHAVEPENRLVARELERRWEQAMQDQWELQEQYDRFLAASPRELTADDLQKIRRWPPMSRDCGTGPALRCRSDRGSFAAWWNASPWLSGDRASGSTWSSGGSADTRAGMRCDAMFVGMIISVITPCFATA